MSAALCGNGKNWRRLYAVAYRAFPIRRAIAAVALALFAHLAVYEAAPETLEMLALTVVPAEPVVLVPARESEKIPEELLPEEFRSKPQFVPANPNAPVATPKDERNHSVADQRAAQENPDPNSRDRTPTNDGELESSRAIAENVLPRELLPPEFRAGTPELQEPAGKKTSANANVDEPAERTRGADIAVSPAGTLARGEDVPANETPEENARPEPAPRPQILPPPGLKSITMRSNTAVSELGSCSLDAKFSEYGDYTQRMLEAIQAAWYTAAHRSALVQPRAVVIVEFTLNSDGTVDDARIVFSSASEPAAYACLDAVQSRAPFDPWRADMVAIVGAEKDTTRISFHYY